MFTTSSHKDFEIAILKDKTFHISAKTKNSNFSRSNSNFSILTPTFSRDGFYESCFQNPSENSDTGKFKYWKYIVKAEHCREWKLTTVDPQERSTWRSGVRSAMRAASQLPGKGPTDVDDAPAPAR